MPADLLLFFLIVGLLFGLGIPTIRRTVRVPVRLEIVELRDHELSEAQRALFAEMDGRLAALEYRPELTFTVANLQGANLVRGYFNRSAWPVISFNLLRSGIRDGRGARMLEITSKLADGGLLITRNSPVAEVLDPLPHQLVWEYPGVDDPGVLLAHHERRGAELSVHGFAPLRPETLVEALADHHRRWTDWQVERGLLVRAPDGETLHPTTRTALRGIRNFLDPFADDFTWWRAFAVVAVGLVLPALGAWALSGPLSPRVTWVAAAVGVSVGLVRALILAVLLTFTGGVVGTLFAGKALIWTSLLGYLPLRLVGLEGLVPLCLSLWTGFVADVVGRWWDRRHDVLR